MIRGVAAVATDPVAGAAARATIESGSSAVDATIAGFFAAAGDAPGVLLSPVVALVAGLGVGSGARAFDGRALQPGIGVKRPRGFVEIVDVPDAAYFATPRSLHMVALLHSYLGRAKLRELAGAGVAAAIKKGASRRAALLSSIGESGVTALRDRHVERALLNCGGAVAGGLLSAEDLREARPIEEEATSIAVAGGLTVHVSPWTPSPDSEGAEAIVACDARGIMASLTYQATTKGIAVDELELLAPFQAEPVRRGIQRVAPGTPINAPAPIALVARSSAFWLGLALMGRNLIGASVARTFASAGPLTSLLEALRFESGSRLAVAVAREGSSATAHTSAA